MSGLGTWKEAGRRTPYSTGLVCRALEGAGPQPRWLCLRPPAPRLARQQASRKGLFLERAGLGSPGQVSQKPKPIPQETRKTGPLKSSLMTTSSLPGCPGCLHRASQALPKACTRSTGGFASSLGHPRHRTKNRSFSPGRKAEDPRGTELSGNCSSGEPQG